MPIYLVHSLDVWGNPVDGYEINEERDIGEVYIPVRHEEENDVSIIAALVERRFLSSTAQRAFDDERILIGGAPGDEDIEIFERDTALSAVNEDGEERFIESERDLTDHDVAQTINDDRPLFHLVKTKLKWERLSSFYRLVLPVKCMHMEDYELRIVASYGQEGKNPPVISFLVSPYALNGQPVSDAESDEFDFYLADWVKGDSTTTSFPKNKKAGRIGFDPLTSEELYLTKDQLSDLMVHLDHFLEKGRELDGPEEDEEEEVIQFDVADELKRKGLKGRQCGLNADWSVQAWQLSPGPLNRVSGGVFLLDTEEQDREGWDLFNIVRRFDEEDPEYQGDGMNSEIRTIVEPGRLDKVLDAYNKIAEVAPTHPSAAELDAMPTLSVGQTADLKFDNGETRIWLERVGVDDGSPYDNGVVIERYDGRRWVTEEEYEG